MAPANVHYFSKRSVQFGLPVLVGIVVGAVVLCILSLLLCHLVHRYRQSRPTPRPSSRFSEKQSSIEPRPSYSQLLLALDGVLSTPSMRAEIIRMSVEGPAAPPKAVIAPLYELAPIPRVSPFPFDHSLLLQSSQLLRSPSPLSDKADTLSIYSMGQAASIHGQTSRPLSGPHSRGSSPYGMTEAERDYRLSTTSSKESGDNPLSTEGLMQGAHVRRDNIPIPSSSKSWSTLFPSRNRPERERKRSTLVKRPPPTSFLIISKPIISNPTPITTDLPPGLSAIKAFADPSLSGVHATRYPELVHSRPTRDLLNLPSVP